MAEVMVAAVQAHPEGRGGSGGGNGSTSTPKIEIITIELEKKFPCAKILVIDKLESIDGYNNMVKPFLDQKSKPNLTWKSEVQPWGKGNGTEIYSGGTTAVDKDSKTGMSSIINLNEKLLENGSKLLLAATAIHETYHAYINYLFADKQKPELVDKSSPSYMAGNFQYFTYLTNGAGSNFTDHYNLLTSQFDNMTDILFQYNNGQVSLEDCRKALLFGMDNPGPNPDFNQKNFIDLAYNRLLLKYDFTREKINEFNLKQVNPSKDEKLPGGCK